EISKYFSVTIDDLLSGEALISIAERENKTNIQNLFDLLFGMVDLLSVLLIVLPLYPRTVDGYVYSVNLFEYLETSAMNRFVYWFLFLGLIVLGVWKVLLVQIKSGKHQKLIWECSLLVSIAAVIVLALAGETYAVTVVFLLLLIKGVVLFKSNMV
ncbi:MAG: XRE family transcriptional regulator, partial [Lachnospiraceae bacterium]|nr:XRE family transcriptional regulator [Lachnospiraceae bacterium]